jgi:hypothetical protein
MLTLLTYESVGDLNKPCQYSPMFGRQERVAILLLLSVAVVVISAHLALGTLGKQPFAHTFAENSADGELVSASGIVEQISYTKNGGHMNVYLNSQQRGFNFCLWYCSNVSWKKRDCDQLQKGYLCHS